MFEFLYYVLYIVFGCEFVLSLADLKFPKSKIRIYGAIVVFLLIAVAFFLFEIPDRRYFNFFFPMVSILLGTGLVMGISKDDGFRGLFPFLSALFFITISDTIGNSVYVYAIHTWNDWRVITPEILFMSAILLCIKKYIKPFYSMTSKYDSGSWFAMDMVLMVYEFMSFMMSVTMDFEKIIFIRLGLEFITMIVFVDASVISGKTLKEQHHEYEKKILDDQVRAESLQINNFQERERQLKHVRHDIRGMLADLKEYVTDEKALAIICRINDELDKTKAKIYCNNMHVNAIIAMYANQAGTLDIEFKAMVDIPEKFSLDIVEFNIMLSNLLENAMDGCRAMHRFDDKFIRMQARTTKNVFIFEMKCSDKRQASLVEQAKDYIEKLGGIYDCTAEKECTTTKILIHI